MSRGCRRPRRGFTLVEVVLATVLMVTVVLAAYGLYDATHRLQRQAQASGDTALQAQFAFRHLEADLRAAWVGTLDDQMRRSTTARMNAGLASAVMQAMTESQQQAQQVDLVGEPGTRAVGPDSFRDDYLELTTAAGNAVSPARGDLVRARYFVVRDDQQPRRSMLVRTARPLTATRLGSADRLPAPDEYTVMARGVVGFECGYRAGSIWTDGWDTSVEGGWPQAVEVTLVLEAESGQRRQFRTEVPLRVPSEIGSASSASAEEESP
jgi:prepilin-type N-terminal cleavage/methylation domain-containing protein